MLPVEAGMGWKNDNAVLLAIHCPRCSITADYAVAALTVVEEKAERFGGTLEPFKE